MSLVLISQDSAIEIGMITNMAKCKNIVKISSKLIRIKTNTYAHTLTWRQLENSDEGQQIRIERFI